MKKMGQTLFLYYTRKISKIVSVPIFFIFFLLVVSCSAGSAQAPVGKTAPDFTLKDTGGKTVSLSDFKGKNPVLLVFWATWCPACRHEIPELKSTYTAYASRGLVILAVDVQENPKAVAEFARKNNLPYIVLVDEDGDVAGTYGVYGIPHNVFIDTQGIIRQTVSGSPGGGMAGLLEPLLK